MNDDKDHKQISLEDEKNIIENRENGQSAKRKRTIKNKQEHDSQRKKSTKIIESCFEHAIYTWLKQKWIFGEPISGAMLKQKALLYHNKIYGPSDFSASNEWLESFKIRYGLPTNNESQSRFQNYFKTYIEVHKIDPDNIYNFDEFSLAFRSLPIKMKEEIFGEKSGKIAKDKVVLGACVNASGKHKIRLMVVGKSRITRNFENRRNWPVHFFENDKVLMDKDIFLEWYKGFFLPAIKARKPSKNERFILLLDNAPSHPPASELNTIDSQCTTMFLPPNVSSLFQPLNQGIIETLRMTYKKSFLRGFLARYFSSKNVVPKWTFLDFCFTIADSWHEIKKDAIEKSWESFSLEKYPEKMSHSECLCDLLELLRNVPRNISCTSHEVNSWLVEDDLDVCQRKSDDEILTECAGIGDLVEDKSQGKGENEEDIIVGDEVENKVLTMDEVLVTMDSVCQWIRTRPEMTIEDGLAVEKIRKKVTEIVLRSYVL